MKASYYGIVAVVLTMVVAAPASARTEEENWDRCLQQDKVGPLEPEEIIAACRFVLRMDLIPPNVRNDAYNNIGVSYRRLNKLDDAIQAFSEALRKIRDLPDIPEVRQLGNYTRRNRAIAYIAAKRYTDALNDYDAMAGAEAIPKYRALRCLAHALYDDAYTSALADCQKAIEADKNAGDAYTGWLIVEYRQGSYAEVKSDCELAKQKTFLPIEAHYVCVLADRRLGNSNGNDKALQFGLDSAMEHGDRFRELGMVP